jgi:hypothetical protein
VTVNVAASATSPQVNTAVVSGGGASSATATDSTVIIPEVVVPNVVGNTQAAATSAINAAGLVVGTVTTAPSTTVPSGSVISESPAAGTSVVAGSAVNLVVSSGSAGPPTIVSLSPTSGSGLTQTFTGVYSDPNGIVDLSSVIMLLNTSSKLSSACAVVYTPASNKMYLYNDAGTGLSSAVVPGSSSSAANSQCTLKGTGSSFSTSANNLTLNVALTFTGTFLGQKNVYLYAAGKAGNSGFIQKGTWTPSSAGPPTVVSLTPNSGTGLSQTFAAVFSDPNGIADLNSVVVLFNTSVKLSSACAILYNAANNKMFLYNNAGTALSAGVVPGSTGSVSNSQCTLKGTGSSVSTSGNNLTVNAAVTFSGTFTGSKNVYLHAAGKTGSSSWVQKGAWTP